MTTPVIVGTYGAPLDLGDAVPEGINDAGVVVGSVGSLAPTSEDGVDDLRAAWWPADSTEPLLVDVAPGELTRGYAVNDRGELLVGTGHAECPKDVYVVDPSTGTSVRRDAAADECSQPWSFNDAAEVVINRTFTSLRSDSIVWEARTGDEIPPPTDLGDGIFLSDVNNLGQVVGMVDGGMPFFWDRRAGTVQYLDIAGASGGAASHVNDRGQILGRLFDATVFWDGPTAAPRPLGDSSMYPAGINGHGQVLLSSNAATGAWVWDPRTEALSELPEARQAFGINDLGQVVGIAGSPGASFAARWIPND